MADLNIGGSVEGGVEVNEAGGNITKTANSGGSPKKPDNRGPVKKVIDSLLALLGTYFPFLK